jgi:ABC-type oligopeptide transport system substrate-binding subunit
MNWFAAVKPNTPYSENGIPVMASAGPYYIKSRDVGRSLVAVRNPNYKGNRPANPDQIVFTVNTDQAQTFLQVQKGDFDYDAGAGAPPTAYAGLAQQYGINKGRFFVNSTSCVYYFPMNTTRAPFNNLNARKGMQWAIDRPALVRLGGAFGGKRTDQILVPGIPGFKDFHIYAIKGADPAKAKQVAGTVNGTVTVYHSTSIASTNRAQVVEYNLKQMGFGTKDKVAPGGVYYPQLETKGFDFDLATSPGWCADFNDPYDFINVLLDGRTIQDNNNVNFAYYNNAQLNAQMDAAAQKSGAARNAAYSKLDFDVMTKHSPWIPWQILNQRTFVAPRVKNHIYNQWFVGPALNALAIAG